METAKIKLELFRAIDQMPEKQLKLAHEFFGSLGNSKNDFYEDLDEWQKEDITMGIQDLDEGRKMDFNDFISTL